jgi:hypothetical protein
MGTWRAQQVQQRSRHDGCSEKVRCQPINPEKNWLEPFNLTMNRGNSDVKSQPAEILFAEMFVPS